MDSESWREDDPVYSEAVCDAKDTYYYGSEDEEYNDPAERRQRYEAAAQRFLSGEQGSILLSASLRGPFGYDQGWLNPWRSKRQIGALPPASRSEKSKPQRSQPEKPSQTQTQDSQVSHLPSPESLKQVEIEPHPFLEENDVNRVQQWQRTVREPQVQDELTANITPSSQTSTLQRKRRAKSSDWLRQSSSKKRKTPGAIEGESIKTPTRRPRKTVIPQSSARPQPCFTASFRSSSLCPGDQDDDDELGVDDGSRQAPISSLIKAPKRQLSPTKRHSPKRAMLNSNKIDSTESADELSQETAKDSQAAATLSSPVSMKDKPVASATHSTGSPVKKVRTTQKRSGQEIAPVTQNVVSPFKKLRTPRIRKSRTRHRIEALRAPLPRPERKRVEVVEPEASKTPTQQPEGVSTPALQIQKNKASITESLRDSEVEKAKTTETLVDVRASSPLSDISSSCGSVSWSGISSPEAKVTHGRATRTSTQSIPTASYEESEDSEVEDEYVKSTHVTSIDAATEAHATVEDMAEAESDDELDSDIDASSELSDISMRDIYLRNSSVARMDDLVPASEKIRLDAELDSDDGDPNGPEEEEKGSESDMSGYETAHSQRQSRETTPMPASTAHVLHSAREKDFASLSESSPGSFEGFGSEDDTFRGTAIAEKERQTATHAAEASRNRGPLEEVEDTYEVTTQPCDETVPDSRDEPHMRVNEETKDLAAKPCDETIPDSHEVTGLSTVVNSIFEASNVGFRAQSPSNEVIENTEEGQNDLAQHISPDTTNGGNVTIYTTAKESVPLSSFECTVPDEIVNLVPGDLAAEASTPQPSSPEQPFRPFADFLSPSPEKKARQRCRTQMQASMRRVSDTEGNSISSILRTPWSYPKPKKRVSFAPLAGEEENDILSTASGRSDRERPASPPPQTAVEQLPTSSEAEFQGHFNAMAKRASACPPRMGRIISSPTPASQGHNVPLGTPLAADKVSNSFEPTDTEGPGKCLFNRVGSENKPPSKDFDDFDDVFDNLASMLRPYDLEAELDEARTGEMEGLSFGGW